MLFVVDSNDHSPDEGLIEDFAIVDKKAVEQLTEGLISHYLPDLQRSKLALKELTYVRKNCMYRFSLVKLVDYLTCALCFDDNPSAPRSQDLFACLLI